MTLFKLKKDTWGNRIKWTVIKIKNRISRGQHWLSFLNIAIYIGAIANIGTLNNNPNLAYEFVAGYLIGCYTIGYLDEVYGVWKMEAVWGTERLNPPMKKLIEDVVEVKEGVKRLINDKGVK